MLYARSVNRDEQIRRAEVRCNQQAAVEMHMQDHAQGGRARLPSWSMAPCRVRRARVKRLPCLHHDCAIRLC